jgi:arsenate reductase (glutaredoxin)
MEIYHNPKCSKSRQALALLQEKRVNFDVIEYLKDTPTKEELKNIVAKLNVPVISIIRVGEEVWKENYADKDLSDDELFDAIVKYPILLQRPIIVSGDKAVIGRPTEEINKLL